MANVKVGTRSKADDKKALVAAIETEVSTGKELVEEGGMKFLVERAPGITIKTRIE